MNQEILIAYVAGLLSTVLVIGGVIFYRTLWYGLNHTEGHRMLVLGIEQFDSVAQKALSEVADSYGRMIGPDAFIDPFEYGYYITITPSVIDHDAFYCHWQVRAAVEYARKKGFTYIKIDADGPINLGLKKAMERSR